MEMREILNRLSEAQEDEDEHADALERTGFWGSAGAGGIFFAKSTKRFMLGHRSQAVEQPNTYSTFGGAIDKGENPKEATAREVHEEAGYVDEFTLESMFVFQSGTFHYSNFLIVIDEEFEPRLNWENQGYIWCKFGQWPKPLHFGIVSLLKDPASVKLMKTLASSKPESK